jgi:hypothetical protein
MPALPGITKVVVLFSSATDIKNNTSVPALGYTPRIHTGGWSETLYSNLTPSQIVSALTQSNYNGYNPFLPWRASCLPVQDAIIGVRLYQGSNGRGQALALSYPGGFLADEVPQMGLLLKGGATGTANTRRWIIRGVPDDSVTGGEFNPAPNFTDALGNFLNAYGNFGFIGNDLTKPRVALLGVDAGGHFKVKPPATNPFIIGDYVTCTRMVDSVTGLFRRFAGPVTAIDGDASGFTCASFTGNSCNGGSAQINSPIYCPFNISTITVVRVTLRKVGRPFEVYRGRRSKRRKTA